MPRKSKYETSIRHKLILVEGWARNGLTDDQIAKNLGIHPSTLYDYKNKYPKFSESLKKGKEVIDFEVENALLKSALGYEYKEQTVTRDGDIVTIKKQQAPNTTAQIFWLKNRKPKDWRDKQDMELSGGVEVNNPMSKLSVNDLERLAKLSDGE